MLNVNNADDFSLAGYDWSSRQLLGQGGFGKVFKVKSSKHNGNVAIKQMRNMVGDMQMLQTQIGVMAKLSTCPNILKLLEHKIGSRYTYLVLELCDGDLRHFAKQYPGNKVPEQTCVEIYCQIMQGFKVLTEYGYIHRDVKPENVLYNKGGLYKVSDFGLARQADINGSKKISQICGTPLYMSPQQLDDLPYTSKCDIWSLGIMLYQLVFGYSPWPCRTLMGYRNAIYTKPLAFPYNISIGQNVKDFIKRCLVIDQRKRISWAEILKHPLIHKQQIGQKSKLIVVNESAAKIFRRMQESAFRKNIDVIKVLEDKKFKSADLQRFGEYCRILDSSISSAEIKVLFGFLDKNKDGQVSFDQFKEIYAENDFRDGLDYASRFVREIVEAVKVQKMDLRALFDKYDKNKDKNLSIGEFINLVRQIMPSLKTDQTLSIFHKFDKDGWGTISLSEFLEEVTKGYVQPNNNNNNNNKENMQRSLTSERAKRNLKGLRDYIKLVKINSKQIYALFDRDRSGKIEIGQFKRLVRGLLDNLPDNEIQEMFEYIDKDKSGAISQHQFQEYTKG